MGKHIEIRTKTPALEIHQADDVEKEFIESAGDVEKPPVPLKRARKYEICPIGKLSDNQINDAADRVVMGASIAKVAEELGVNPKDLSRKIKERMGILYMRGWQQSIKYDCVRNERILKSAMERLDESPKWGKLALECLAYRARILGFEHQRPEETSIRVAGMSQEQVFAEIVKKL